MFAKKTEEAVDNGLPKFDDLETRITKLEVLFKYLKKMKEKKENADRESCGSS